MKMGRSDALHVLAVFLVTIVCHGHGAETVKPAVRLVALNKNVTVEASNKNGTLLLVSQSGPPLKVTTEAPKPPPVTQAITLETAGSLESTQDDDTSVTKTIEQSTSPPSIGRDVRPVKRRKKKKKKKKKKIIRRILGRGEKDSSSGDDSSGSYEEGINHRSADQAASDTVEASEESYNVLVAGQRNHAVRKRWRKWLNKFLANYFNSFENAEDGSSGSFQNFGRPRPPSLNARRHIQSFDSRYRKFLERRRQIRERQRRQRWLEDAERQKRFEKSLRQSSRWPPINLHGGNGRPDKNINRFNDDRPWNEGERYQFYEPIGDHDHKDWLIVKGREEEKSAELGRSMSVVGQKAKKKKKHIKTLRRGEWVSVSVEEDGVASDELYGPPHQ